MHGACKIAAEGIKLPESKIIKSKNCEKEYSKLRLIRCTNSIKSDLSQSFLKIDLKIEKPKKGGSRQKKIKSWLKSPNPVPIVLIRNFSRGAKIGGFESKNHWPLGAGLFGYSQDVTLRFLCKINSMTFFRENLKKILNKALLFYLD